MVQNTQAKYSARSPITFLTACLSFVVLNDGSSILVDDKILHDLQMIEGANLLEQKCGADMIVSFTANRSKNETDSNS